MNGIENAKSSSGDQIYTFEVHKTSYIQPIYRPGHQLGSFFQSPVTKSTIGTITCYKQSDAIKIREKESSFTHGWLSWWINSDRGTLQSKQ